MTHSLAPIPATATASTSVATPVAKPNKIISSHIRLHKSHQCPKQSSHDVHRRSVTLSLAGFVLGLNVGDRNANAARRPPPPPPEEKKDPNVSGVQAKVLASKKRKEAMKQAIAKMREKGKALDEPSSPPE